MISYMPCVVAVEAWDSEMFGYRMPANATNLCDLVVLQTIDVFGCLCIRNYNMPQKPIIIN